MARLRGVAVGAGYFSQFHFEAWSRIPEIELVAVCDARNPRVEEACSRFAIPRGYTNLEAMLAAEKPDFLDVLTPPATHAEILRAAGPRGIHVLCQKPLAPDLSEAQKIVRSAKEAGIRLMVHDNFRFQPWHREIKRLLETGVIGSLHSLTFRCRPGDGWGPGAYLARQPYFREMPRFLIVETGVHFIDTYRFLAGEIRRVFALLRKLNPVIAGEDCGLLVFEFTSGAVGLWDANRYNESTTTDPRYTFGEFLVEGQGGSIRLAEDGSLTVQPLGQAETRHEYLHEHRGFAGDCVFATFQHFVRHLLDGSPFETEGTDYLKTLAVQEALYESARLGRPVEISSFAEHFPGERGP